LVGDLGPVRLHHVVGRPAEQELVGLVEPRVYDPPEVVVDVRDQPATAVETVLVSSSPPPGPCMTPSRVRRRAR
jgi:hypothetical protein